MNEAGDHGTKGVAICGITITDTTDTSVVGRILGVQGMGANRLAIPATTNDSVDKWGEFIYSCIATQKAFRITAGFNQNDANWISDIQAGKKAFEVDLPAEDGYSTGALLTFDGGYTDFEFGGELQTMVLCSITIQPTGKPTATAGTVLT